MNLQKSYVTLEKPSCPEVGKGTMHGNGMERVCGDMAELAEEPFQYKKLVDVAMAIGEVMLKHGAETYRVEDTMRRILGCAGVEYRDAYVTYTGIILTLTEPSGETITKVKRVENRGSNYNKIYLANNLSRKLCAGDVSVKEAEREIREIRESRVYRERTIWISTVLVASMFVVLLGGSFQDALVAGVNGLIIVSGQLCGRRFRLSGVIVNLLVCIATAFFTRLMILAGGAGMFSQDVIIIGSIMPLVPGVAITNAIRDTLQGDYMSGGSRAIEAFVTAAAIAVGIGMGLTAFQMVVG